MSGWATRHSERQKQHLQVRGWTEEVKTAQAEVLDTAKRWAKEPSYTRALMDAAERLETAEKMLQKAEERFEES